MKANCLKRLDRYEEAIECYKKIIEINPSNKEALDEIKCYKAMRINPSDEETWYMKAECLKRSKRYEEVRKCYNKQRKEYMEHSDTRRISLQQYEDIIKDHFIMDDEETLEKQLYSKENFEYGDYEYENDSD